MTAVYTGFWISDGWFYSRDPQTSAKYWITDNWIWGPVGPETGTAVQTGYWIEDNFIWGPAGAGTGKAVCTGFWISEGHIYGPESKPPFVKGERRRAAAKG